jgi:hypothetical protein
MERRLCSAGKETLMRNRSLIIVLPIALIGVGAFWANSTLALNTSSSALPSKVGETFFCPEDGLPHEWHTGGFEGLGTFQEVPAGEPSPIVAKIGQPFLSDGGLKTVPLQILSIGGHGFAEGIGHTHFWLDASRPVRSAIWEKRAGTEFPAIQEMRFHFFYTLEAMPGKIFRSINPAVMRSDNVRAFPPPPGTVYRLARVVEMEDMSDPGVVVGRILSNRVTIPRAKPPLKPELSGE